MTRPSWDTYFMQLAVLASTRGTCDRKQVGAILVRGRRVIATGYNGSPAGAPQCDEVGHEMVEVNGRMSCVRTLHAESNAIDWAGKEANRAAIYTTAAPCYECAKRIVSAGIREVYYGEWYPSQNTERAAGLFAQAHIQVTHVVLPPNPADVLLEQVMDSLAGVVINPGPLYNHIKEHLISRGFTKYQEKKP